MKRFRTLSGQEATPAAGQGASIVLSPVQRVRLHTGRFTLTTDATVATRLVWVQVQDPTGLITFETGWITGEAASQTYAYVLSPHFSSPAAMDAQNGQAIALPFPDLWLPPGWQIVIGVTAKDANDQLSAFTYAADFAQDIWDQDGEQATALAFLASLT
jgi:hypothetical protein